MRSSRRAVSSLARPQDPVDTSDRPRSRSRCKQRWTRIAIRAGRADIPKLEARFGRADSAGVFEFLDVTAGTYRLGGSKAGYFPVSGREPTAPSVDLAEDEKRDDVEITLTRWGTLAGRILDEYGDPMQGVSIQLLHVRYEAGRRRLVSAGETTTAWGWSRASRTTPAHIGCSVSLPVSTLSARRSAMSPQPMCLAMHDPISPAHRYPLRRNSSRLDPAQDVAGIDLTLSRTQYGAHRRPNIQCGRRARPAAPCY